MTASNACNKNMERGWSIGWLVGVFLCFEIARVVGGQTLVTRLRGGDT
jgi:hypothetical protein